MTDRYLTPAEVAKRFGTSIKALRLYEQRGLLTPLRTNNGSTGSAWRVYGPEQLSRLHQILTLKSLGLSLAQISGVLLSGDALGPVLELQEANLVSKEAQCMRAIQLVRAARSRLASGQSLSIDDLATLTKETVMTGKFDLKKAMSMFPDPEKAQAALSPLVNKQFTVEELKEMRERILNADSDPVAIRNEFRAVMESGADPTSPVAQALAVRLSEWRRIASGGDPTILERMKAIVDNVRMTTDVLPPKELALDDYMRTAREHFEAAKRER